MVEKQEDYIYSFGIASVFFTSMLAIFLGVGTYIIYSISEHESAMVAFLAGIVVLAISYIFITIFNNNTCRNLYEYSKELYGKTIGTILNILIIITLSIISCIALYSIANFLNIEYLPESDINCLKLLILVPIIYMCTKNLPALIKCNQVFFLVAILILAFDILGVFGEIDITNLEPVFSLPKLNYVKSFLYYTCFSIVPLFMILITNKSKIYDKEKVDKKLYIMIAFSCLTIAIVILFTILVLGKDYVSSFRFPEYIALKQFKLFSILERIENILALVYLFVSYCLLSNLIYMITDIFEKKKNKFVFSIILMAILVLVSSIVFKEAITFLSIVNKYIYYVILAGLILPVLLIFIKSKISTKNSK